jgi:hypothetical protein
MENETISQMLNYSLKSLIRKLQNNNLYLSKPLLPKYQEPKKHIIMYINHDLSEKIKVIYNNHNTTMRHIFELAMQEYVQDYCNNNDIDI